MPKPAHCVKSLRVFLLNFEKSNTVNAAFQPNFKILASAERRNLIFGSKTTEKFKSHEVQQSDIFNFCVVFESQIPPFRRRMSALVLLYLFSYFLQVFWQPPSCDQVVWVWLAETPPNQTCQLTYFTNYLADSLHS